MLKTGDLAPDFSLKGHDDNDYTLSAFRGQKVVLVFYPLDFSPVCEKEHACFRDDLKTFQAARARVFGISVDSTWTHRAFARELALGYPLLSDFQPRGAVGRSYGVHIEERGFNGRSTFIINSEGRIADIFHYDPPVVPEMAPVLAAVTAG